MSLRSFGFVAMLAVSGSPAFAAGCHVDPFSTVFGADTDAHMTVKSGQRCGITMRTGGRGMSRNIGGTTGTTLDQQAQHGTVIIPEPHRIEYVSQRGYTGSDQFVFERTGETMSQKTGHTNSGTSHYTVHVDVVP
ncbi:hypothetical protein [Lichenibacterium dinghuense]|uniref:hypothetical protein n=1 Tax=Lichenibacterium dinghuense TaxID=2895977 RepID=UPI001F2E3B2E|nr:hypothetical protein [Lichenibacterium sp. 6Y81]